MTKRLNQAASAPVTWGWPVVVLSTLSFFGVTAESAVASYSWQPETLRNISQLHVQVEKECQFGASAERLREGVENYLHRHGLPISSNPDNQSMTPRLAIGVECGSNTRDTTLSIGLRVIQDVQLNGQTIEARTYTGPGVYGFTQTSAEYAMYEPEIITELLDGFIADWNSVQ